MLFHLYHCRLYRCITNCCCMRVSEQQNILNSIHTVKHIVYDDRHAAPAPALTSSNSNRHTKRTKKSFVFTLGYCHFLIQLFSRIFKLAHVVRRFHFQRRSTAKQKSLTEKRSKKKFFPRKVVFFWLLKHTQMKIKTKIWRTENSFWIGFELRDKIPKFDQTINFLFCFYNNYYLFIFCLYKFQNWENKHHRPD